MRVRKAVIPAAGLGTRFLPATKAQPKEMLPIVDTPIIQLVVEEAVDAGIEDILIITGRGKRAIEDHFDRTVELEQHLMQQEKEGLLQTVRDISSMVNIHFIRQKEPLGLGHAVLQARQHVGDEPFAVLLGDELFWGEPSCLSQLLAVHDRVGGTILATRRVEREAISLYGVLAAASRSDGLLSVSDLVEKPAPEEAPSNWAVLGRYIIEPQVFSLLEGQPAGVNAEIQLTDTLRSMARDDQVWAVPVTGERFDVGNRLGFLQATVAFALRRRDLAEPFREMLLQFLDEGAMGSQEAAITRGEK